MAVSAAGGEKIKFAFLSPDAHNQANSAIYNGARDALAELSKNTGKICLSNSFPPTNQ